MEFSVGNDSIVKIKLVNRNSKCDQNVRKTVDFFDKKLIIKHLTFCSLGTNSIPENID